MELADKKKPQPWQLANFMPLLLVLAVALSAAYAVISYQGKIAADFNSQFSNRSIVSSAQLEKKYETSIKTMVGEYLKIADISDSDFAAKTEQLKNGLLSLIVPAKYRDKHLALVLSLDKMESASKDGDSKSVAAELEKIRQDY